MISNPNILKTFSRSRNLFKMRIKMRIKEGINPKRQLLLCLTDSREIPLTGIEQPMALNKIEDEAIKMAKYLNVFLETE